MWLSEKDDGRAQQAFLKAVDLNPLLMEPRLNLAYLYQGQNEDSKARMLLEENLKINPSEERSLVSVIPIYLAEGEKTKAVDLGKKALRKSRNPQKLTSLGSIFARYHFTNMAFSLYFKSLKIDPYYKEAFLEIGKLYGNLGELNRAVLFWQEGLRYHPEEKRFIELITQAKALLQK